MVQSEIFWKVAERSTTIGVLNSRDHGISHWARVAENGKRLGQKTEGCDLLVVEFFALFHDSMRENEVFDPEHGLRATKLAFDLGVRRHGWLSALQWVKFHDACYLHDTGQVSEDPTIGVCWDADRLDLPRVGITPDPAYLSTEAARREIRV